MTIKPSKPELKAPVPPNRAPVSPVAPVAPVAVSDSASATAPVMFFEQASVFGVHDGVVRVTLETVRILPQPDGKGVMHDRVIIAHLRMGVQAARSLKAALEGAILLASPPGGERKN